MNAMAINTTTAAPAGAASTQRPAAVQFVGVSKFYGDLAVVNDVSFEIGEGEFFSLLGPSGCGKSTSLRMVSGFEVPSRGDVMVRGAPMNDVPPHKRPTNMVFQQLGLFPHLNVFDNIAFGLRLKRVNGAEVAKRVQRQLELVNLGQYAKRIPDELSGGQQQRVAIARALVN